ILRRSFESNSKVLLGGKKVMLGPRILCLVERSVDRSVLPDPPAKASCRDEQHDGRCGEGTRVAPDRAEATLQQAVFLLLRRYDRFRLARRSSSRARIVAS